jgi:hypothetical protein
LSQLNGKKFIVCEQQLWQLLEVCSYCGGKADAQITSQQGTFLQVKQVIILFALATLYANSWCYHQYHEM